MTAIIISILLAVIALPLIVALFVRKKYALQRSITINRPRAAVYDYVSQIRNQDAYNKWVMADPHSRKTFRGTDGTVGFVYAWDSDVKQVGQGEQEIKNLIADERVELEVRFVKPFEGRADSIITFQSVSPDQTNVTWGFQSGMKYPMNIMLLFINFEKILGKDLEITLQNLKDVQEK
jgi:uncharacterized protein YndB with AHSA1/START domain